MCIRDSTNIQQISCNSITLNNTSRQLQMAHKQYFSVTLPKLQVTTLRALTMLNFTIPHIQMSAFILSLCVDKTELDAGRIIDCNLKGPSGKI